MDTDKDGNPIGFALGNLSQPRRIDALITLTKEQYETLSKGLMANDGQDSRWIVFCRGREFYFHRSWTGQRIYQASFSNLDNQGNVLDTYSCRSFFVEGNPEIYKAPESDEAIAKDFQDLIQAIISTQL